MQFANETTHLNIIFRKISIFICIVIQIIEFNDEFRNEFINKQKLKLNQI